MYKPLPNEEVFEMTPVGVRYICEHCHEGEMMVDNNYQRNVMRFEQLQLIPHRCNKCNGELLLPKVYPYIEWMPGGRMDEDE